jgi:16S rRNA (guanine966-N2)-methyltransferase
MSLRIIGGKLSGRVIDAPKGRVTRPTSDRVREAMFNIIIHHEWGKKIGDPLKKANVLDAFCGTGALAFEALSRGCTEAFLFDQDRQALRIAQDNAEKLGLKKTCSIMPVDALRPPRARDTCRLIFLDPPYRKNLIAPSLTALDMAGWIAENALVVVESAKKEKLELPENFALLLSRTYGDTATHFVARAV